MVIKTIFMKKNSSVLKIVMLIYGLIKATY